METPSPSPSSLPPPQRPSLGRIVPATCILLLLHFGQDVLRPIAIASILSLVIAPLVRKLARTGIGRTAATLVSVLLVAVGVVWMSAVLAIQLVAVAADLPRYSAAITSKVQSIREVTVRPFERLEAELKGVAPQARPVPAPTPAPSGAQRSRSAAAAAAAAASTVPSDPVPVQIRQAPPTAGDIVSKLLSSVWGPVGEAGIVLVLLVFILLEHESLSDRFIRVIGVARLGPTVQALSETAEGVSRFFLSQFVVNLTFGVVLGAGLWVIGIPHAALWASIGALLRFIPYVGVLGAAALIAVFGAAVDPGWSLVLWSLGLFAALELLVANVVEPQVYGHSTGLAPLAVIVSALFWGAMWGPVGLLLSTPLTLCIVVVGRHVRALEPFAILLTEGPGLNAGQRFYQRALSGNTALIIQDARSYLRRATFAKYCDRVLLPGLALAGADLRMGRIDGRQSERIQKVIVRLAEELAGTRPDRRAARRQRRATVSLAAANVGMQLRQMRESSLGPWQGRLDVPLQSIVLCFGFGTERDDLLTELLVRALRQDAVDARSVSLTDPQDPSRAEKSVLVGTAFLTYPVEGALEQWRTVATEMRAALPDALIATIRLPLDEASAAEELVRDDVDLILHSYAEAEALVLQARKPA
ncbi:AI-2E family transporter [Variovorax sp. ZT4R33]|uniref:AI-2E family transporter n=1 Tax=Variovorax sp. ZT4R33 TaxID=3443743 RepID=UPI003F44E92D